MPARALLANLSTRGKIVLAAGALAVVIVLFVLFRIATAPSYTTLLSGLEPKATGDVTAALDQRGIPWELQNNGTAVAVPRAQTAQARIALAESGVSAVSDKQGYEILDRQKMGTSNFQQQVNYQRAKEGEIANTISEIDGVGDAQVQLVLPDPEAQLFSDNVSPATAAVLLSGTSALDESQVRGIAQLVAGSVPGLRTEKVTITDGTGTPLWPTATSGGSTGLLAKQAAEARYNQMTAATISAMLARTVGPDKVQVQVKADLDANEATQDRLVYGREGTPLVRREERETLDGRGTQAAGGPAGTAGNIPGYAAQGGGESRYERTGEEETNGVNKTRTTTRIAPGAINRQQVAVLVDDSIPAAMLPQIRDAVMSAAGIDVDRGDRLTLGQIAFAQPERPAASSPVDDIWDYARYALLGMAALIFLALLARQLRKRENETLAGEPTWLREIESPRTLAELERYDEPVAPTRVLPVRSPENPTRMQVEELVERDPERVAQHVRAWMQED